MVRIVHWVERMGHHRRVSWHVHGVVFTKNHFEGIKNFKVKVLDVMGILGFAEEGKNPFAFVKVFTSFQKLLPDLTKNLFEEIMCFFGKNLKL